MKWLHVISLSICAFFILALAGWGLERGMYLWCAMAFGLGTLNIAMAVVEARSVPER
ncbi:hypothetical protein ACT6QH_04525 [Xanthobacter sp. TB0139]|uniref:hypothetical protein n=1 Tax=Xanthobacter sp. TB0139 TaxID=3459178 RepID=UPI004039437D